MNLSLSKAIESSSVYIEKVNLSGAVHAKILGMGLGMGSELHILRNRQGDMVIGKGHNRISLGRSLADQIVVKEIH